MRLEEQTIGSDTAFSLEAVLLIANLAFTAGIWWFTLRDHAKRIHDLEQIMDHKVVKKHWFNNWVTLLSWKNPSLGLKVPKPDEIKSPE